MEHSYLDIISNFNGRMWNGTLWVLFLFLFFILIFSELGLWYLWAFNTFSSLHLLSISIAFEANIHPSNASSTGNGALLDNAIKKEKPFILMCIVL